LGYPPSGFNENSTLNPVFNKNSILNEKKTKW